MPLSGMVKRCRWAGWTVALWAGVVMAQPPATNPPAASAVGRITANTPANSGALTADEFTAIVAEAKTVPTNTPPEGGILLPKSWRHLTRGKLTAMLTMPQFGDIPHAVRQVLIDQAATWDLFDYTRPSDAAALWGRVWSVPVEGRPAQEFFSYIPDQDWSPTSLAMASVLKCFPEAAWTSRDPVVDAVAKNGAWGLNPGMVSGGMRDCLPHVGASYVRWTPALQAEVAAILVRKFTAELQADGCTRHGADSCLVIFQALFGLDPDNTELPALLKKMEPAFFDNDVSWWESARNDSTPTKIADVMHPRLIQRMAFLTTKLPVVIDHPSAWPAHELENTLAQAFQTSTQLEQLQDLSYTRYNYRNSDRDLINPVHWLTGKRGREALPALRALAGAYAQTHGCTIPPIAQDQPITHDGMTAFNRAHAIANIRQGNGYCGELSYLDLPELVTASPARRRQLVTEFRPIANQLAKGGSLREDALNQVANACRAKHPAGDPFGLCAEVRARDDAALAAKLAAMPKVDPLACPEDTLANAEQALSTTPEGDDFAACRKDPADTRHAIVALAYHGDAQDANGDDDYDLDVAIVDIDSGDILAHRHEPKGIPSDAVSLGRVWLDTARYDLGPGERAFGVRTENSAHCWQCAFGYTNLSLYLQDGKQLRKLLATTVSETIENDSEDQSTRTVLCVSKQRHHGLADIVMSQGASCEKLDGDSRIWRYDGQMYVQEKPAH